jgi:hypothetical protein
MGKRCIMSSKTNAAIFAVVAQAEGDLRATMLANLATVRKVSLESLTAEFEEFAKANSKKLEAEVRKQEREARKVRVTALVKEGEGITLESENLADFIGRVKAEQGVVSVNEDLSLTVTVELPKARGTGGGKPAKDAPQPYVDSAGDRICGPLTEWTKENLSETEQKEAGCFRPNGKFRTGASLAKALIKAEVISASPVPSE